MNNKAIEKIFNNTIRSSLIREGFFLVENTGKISFCIQLTKKAGEQVTDFKERSRGAYNAISEEK